MITRYVLLLHLLVWLNPALAGDTVSDSGMLMKAQFVDHLIAGKEVDNAALEFERMRRSGGFDSLRIACNLGYAFLGIGEKEKAESYFEQASSFANKPSPGYGRAISGLARTYVLEGKAALAQNELDNLEKPDRETIGAYERLFLNSAIYAARYKPDSARVSLTVLLEDSTFASRAARMDTLLRWYQAQGFKNPLYAFVYSSAIPGWGHWYVGDRKKAAASFGLMALLSGVLCYEGYRMYTGNTEQRYVCAMDILLVWGLGWRRYYSSIRKAAHQKAVEHNRGIQVRFQNELAKIIAAE